MGEGMILGGLIQDRKEGLEDMKREVRHKEISEGLLQTSDHLLEEEEILHTIKEGMIQEESMVVLLLLVLEDVVCILPKGRGECQQNKNLVHHNNRE